MNGNANSKVFWRLVWKQYRQMRSFWVAMAVVAVLIQACFLCSMALSWQRDLDALRHGPLLFHVAMALAAFYALGAGATAFATEHETGTYGFQQALPVSGRRLFWSNVEFAVGSTVLLFLVLWLWTMALAGFHTTEPAHPFTVPALWGSVAVELLVWSVLFSLLFEQPLTAAMLGVAAASFTSFVITTLNADEVWTPHSYADMYFTRLPYRMILAAIVGAVDIWLGSRWFRDAVLPRGVQAVGEGPWRRARSGGRQTAVTDPSRGQVFGRLLWQAWRQSVGMVAGVSALVVPMVLIISAANALMYWGIRVGTNHRSDILPVAWTIFFFTALIAAPIAGSCVFRGDQRRDAFRFLAERGVRARTVWWSRQAVWFSVLIVWLFVVLALFVAFVLIKLKGNLSRLTEERFSAELIFFSLWIVAFPLASYPCGQFCSMVFRSGLLAGFFAVLLSGVVAAWAGFMWAMEVPWLWSVLPLLAAFLAYTWLRAPTWMLERTDWRAKAAPVTLLAATIVGVLLAMVLSRAYQVPLVDPGFSLAEFTRPRTPEEQQTIDLYQRAAQEYVASEPRKGVGNTSERFLPPEPKQEKSARTTRWLDANRPPIDLLLEATKRDACDAFVMPGKPVPQWLRQSLLFSWLLDTDGDRLASEHKLDAALDRYLAALRLARHLRPRSAVPYQADWVERDAYQHLRDWSVLPGQTPSLLRRALEEVTALTSNLPSRSSEIKAAYLRARRALDGDLEAVNDVLRPRERGYAEMMVTIFTALWLPWENTRALRVLNEVVSGDLALFRGEETLVDKGLPPSRSLRYRMQIDREVFRTRYHATPVLPLLYGRGGVRPETDQLLHMETERRAIRLQLALRGWQLEHGSLPDNLQALTGTWFEKLPVDPFAGEPFRYFPQGLPENLTNRVRPEEIEVRAHQPFLWSAGSYVLVRPDDPHNSLFTKYAIIEYQRDRIPVNEMDIWQHGRAFPIAVVAPKPPVREDAKRKPGPTD